MCAIAKWFLGRCTAATKRHPFFLWKLVAVRVDQFHFARYDVRTVLDCFDFYVSHGGNSKARKAKSKCIAMNFKEMNGDFSIQSERNMQCVRFLQLSLCHP